LFTHLEPPLPPLNLKTKTMDGRRYYSINGSFYPSVTSVLSILSRDGIMAWRNSVGYEVANFEARRAANRGTHFHKICEDYLFNRNISKHRKKVLPFGLFSLVKNEIDRIDNIRILEKTLFSHDLKLAGRVDCIAEFDNQLSVIDFKSANKEKSQEILENHFLQETAYAIMWEEHTSQSIEQIVTIVACEDGETQIAIEKPRFFKSKLNDTITKFYQMNNNLIK